MTPVLILRYEVNIPTLNEYIDYERTNKYHAARVKKATTNRIKWWTMEQTRQKLPGMHDLVLIWQRNNKVHDADNVYAGIKFLLDGIVAAGTIPDDSRKHIRHISHRIEQGVSNKVEIQFYKV
jgi:hypothetical protein